MIATTRVPLMHPGESASHLGARDMLSLRLAWPSQRRRVHQAVVMSDLPLIKGVKLSVKAPQCNGRTAAAGTVRSNPLKSEAVAAADGADAKRPPQSPPDKFPRLAGAPAYERG